MAPDLYAQDDELPDDLAQAGDERLPAPGPTPETPAEDDGTPDEAADEDEAQQ